MTRTKPPLLVAGAAFALLGAAFGYVAASAYITHRLGGSVQNLDLLYLGRNLLLLQDRAPREFGIVAALVGGGLLLGLLVAGALGAEKLTQFGTTAWQSRREIKRSGFLGRPETGFILGKLGEPKSKAPFLVSETFPHALVVAPTGRGKGVGFVIPNLLAFAGSVVVLDVKGENFRETARRRQKMKDTVIRFAPGDWSGTPSHRYNPLERIAKIKNQAQQMMELRLTASLFLQPDSPSTAGLLQGGIDLFVAAGMLAFQRGRPTLGEIYRSAVEGGDKQAAYTACGVEVAFQPAKLIFKNLASINDRTLTSYLSLLLTSGLDTWSNPAIDAITSVSDFSFQDIRRHPHAIYLEVAPEMIRPLAPLIRLFFSDLIASLQSRPPEEDERFRVLILLDEFDRLGRMPIVAESIKTLRGYGAHLALVTQTIPALDEIYGENTRLSIQGGAGVKVYLTPSDRKTIAELSASLGSTTKRIISRSRPLGPHTLKSRSLTERTEVAPLLTEDEVRTMDLDDVVLVIDGMNPIRARRIKYYEDRTLADVHARQSGPCPYPEPPAEDVPPSVEDDPAPPPVKPSTSGPGRASPATTGPVEEPVAETAPSAPLGPVATPDPQTEAASAASVQVEEPAPKTPPTADVVAPEEAPPSTDNTPVTRRGVLRRGVQAVIPSQVGPAYLASDVAEEDLGQLQRLDALHVAEAAAPDEADPPGFEVRPWVSHRAHRMMAPSAVPPDPAWPVSASMLALQQAVIGLKVLAEEAGRAATTDPDIDA